MLNSTHILFSDFAMRGVKVILESGLHIFIKITFSFLIPRSSSFWEAFLPCYRDDSGSRRDGSGVINLRDSGGINPPLTFPYPPPPPAELCEKWRFDCSRTLPLMYMLGKACNCYSANCLTGQVCVPPGGEGGWLQLHALVLHPVQERCFQGWEAAVLSP